METRSGSVCDYAFPVSVQSKHCFLLFFFLLPPSVPTRAGHFADSFRSLWKGYCRAERTKCFVRKDGFYFKVFPLIVHLCGELLLFEAKVSSRGWSECVCVRAGVCAPGARLLSPLFQFAVVNIQLYPCSEQSRQSLLLYLFFSIEIPHCCWWPAASATAPRLPFYHYLWPARDRKPLLLSCLNISPLNFILVFYLLVCVLIYLCIWASRRKRCGGCVMLLGRGRARVCGGGCCFMGVCSAAAAP